MSRPTRRRLLLALPFGLAACGLSERPYVERREWPLVLARPSDRPARRNGRVLLVRTVRAGPGLEARGLQSVQPDGSIRTEVYEEWSVPPAQGVEDGLRSWLAGSGLFAAVIAPGSRLAPDLVLEGELTAFWAVLPRRVARAALAVTLIDTRAATQRIALQRRFEAEAPLPGPDAADEVAALRAALASVFAAVERALRPTG